MNSSLTVSFAVFGTINHNKVNKTLFNIYWIICVLQSNCTENNKAKKLEQTSPDYQPTRDILPSSEVQKEIEANARGQINYLEQPFPLSSPTDKPENLGPIKG